MGFNVLSFDFVFVLGKKYKNAVRKVYKELEQNRQQEEDQENVIAFDFNTR